MTPGTVEDLLGTPEARPRLLIVDDQPLNIRLLNQVFQA